FLFSRFLCDTFTHRPGYQVLTGFKPVAEGTKRPFSGDSSQPIRPQPKSFTLPIAADPPDPSPVSRSCLLAPVQPIHQERRNHPVIRAYRPVPANVPVVLPASAPVVLVPGRS